MPSLTLIGSSVFGTEGTYTLPLASFNNAPTLSGHGSVEVNGVTYHYWSTVLRASNTTMSGGVPAFDIPDGQYYVHDVNSGYSIRVSLSDTGQFQFGPFYVGNTTVGRGAGGGGSDVSDRYIGVCEISTAYGTALAFIHSRESANFAGYYAQYSFCFEGIADIITPDTQPDPYGPAPGSAGAGSTPGGGGDAGAPNGFPDGTPSSTSDSKKDRGGLNTALKAYRVSAPKLGNLVSIFWGNTSGGLWDDLWQRFQNYKFNPLSSIIACHSLPTGLVPTTGVQEHIFCAGTDLASKDSALVAPSVSQQWTHWHSSVINLAGPYVNYADYSHSSVYIHLPFCGIVQVDVSAVMDGSIYVDYYCDVLTGNCAAWVIGTNFEGITQLLKCATGNCAYSLPLFGNDNGTGAKINAAIGFAQGMLSMGSQAAHGAISGNFSGMPTNFDLAGNYLRTAAQVATAQHHTESVGSLGGSVGFAGSTEVFLICDWPFPIETENYTTVRGRPSEVSGIVGSFNGYCELEVNPVGIGGATDEEKEAIRKLCAAGVIV